MKTGIIIPCYNVGRELDVNSFIKFVEANKEYHICFVNNGSKDNTLQLFYNLQMLDNLNFSIVDVKRRVSNENAVRAGVRFLYNQSNVPVNGYIVLEFSNDLESVLKKQNIVDNSNELYKFYGLGRWNFAARLSHFLKNEIKIIKRYRVGFYLLPELISDMVKSIISRIPPAQESYLAEHPNNLEKGKLIFLYERI
ncbi:glycosyltransferase [Neptunitalea chrysea]|nr:glycosyltransferase [Neptunitalea chrysea]